jgi:hypothetical protein
VEVLDKYFGSVCELDIIFNFEKAYFILDELILGGEMQVPDTVQLNCSKTLLSAFRNDSSPCWGSGIRWVFDPWILDGRVRSQIQIRPHTRVSDPHWFNADPDTDPGPEIFLIADPGFDDVKLKKMCSWKFNFYFLDQNCNLLIPRPP